MLAWMDSGLSRIEKTAMWGCRAVLLFIMIVLGADVLLRYAFNAPLRWSYDLISIYLVVAIFYLSVSDTLRTNNHVAVDLFIKYAPRWFIHTGQGCAYLLAAAIIAWASWQLAQEAWLAYVQKEVIPGVIGWPTWIPAFLAMLGLAVFGIRLLLVGVAHVMALGRTDTANMPVIGDVFLKDTQE